MTKEIVKIRKHVTPIIMNAVAVFCTDGLAVFLRHLYLGSICSLRKDIRKESNCSFADDGGQAKKEIAVMM